MKTEAKAIDVQQKLTPNLSRQSKLIAPSQCSFAHSGLTGGPDIDLNEFMKHGEFNTMKTASNQWGTLENKIASLARKEQGGDGSAEQGEHAAAWPSERDVQQPSHNCKVAAVTFLGIDLTMNPATVRQLVASGHIRALPEERFLYLVKAEAKAMYDQQKFTPFFHARVSPKRHSVAVSHNADFSRFATERTPLRTSSALYISKKLRKALTWVQEAFEEINRLLPSLQGGQAGFSKSEILRETAIYLEQLVAGNAAMDQYMGGVSSNDSGSGADNEIEA